MALDSPQDPVPVSSVSVVVPPPPPPKNAARILALALAESAQQASVQTQKRPDIHSDCPSHTGTEDEVAVLEMFHPYSGVTPEMLHLYTAIPENQLSFQATTPGEHQRSLLATEQALQNSSTPDSSDRFPVSTPGTQDHPLHLITMSGEGHNGTSMNCDHSHFHPCTLGDTHYFTHPVVPTDQNQANPCTLGSGDPEPPATETSVDEPHLHTCPSVDKSQIQSNKPHCSAYTMDDKLQFLSIATEEQTATTSVGYVATIQTAATETDPGTSSQIVERPPPPTTAPTNSTWEELSVMTAQHVLAAGKPAPTLRPGDSQPAVGQTPATATKVSSGFNQVNYSQILVLPRQGFRYKTLHVLLNGNIPFKILIASPFLTPYSSQS